MAKEIFRDRGSKTARINVIYNDNGNKVKFEYPENGKNPDGTFLEFLMIPYSIIYVVVFYLAMKILNYNFTTLIGVLSIIIIPYFSILILIYYPFRERWNNLYPKTAALVKIKKEITLNTLDIESINDRYCIEIPLFENVLLDFSTTGDFTNLDEIDITEYKYYTISKLLKRKTYNTDLWKARFYFKNKPTEGYIKIIFC